MKCESHEDLVKQVTQTATNTSAILIAIQNLEERFQNFEERLYAVYGKTSGTAGVLSGALKTMGIATAIGGAVFAAIKLAVG